MSLTKNFEKSVKKLRNAAEERLVVTNKVGQEPSHSSATRLLHELQVHQIELEMQNQELIESSQERELLLEKYQSLYDFDTKEVLNLIINTMQDLICWKDLSGIIMGCNANFAQLVFGRTREEIIGKTYNDINTNAGFSLAAPDLVSASRQEDLTAMAHETGLRSEKWHHLANGTRRCFDSIKVALRNSQGEPLGMLLVARDITNSKLLNETIILSEERYRTLFINMSEGFFLLESVADEQGLPDGYRFIEVNNAFEKLTGLNQKDVVGKRLLEVIPDEDPRWIAIYGRVAQSRVPEQFVKYSKALDRYYSMHVFSPRPGKLAVLFHDKTDRITFENELRFSQSRMKDAQRVAKLGDWEFDHTTGHITCSDEILRIVELDPAHVTPVLETFIAAIHPDDSEKAVNAWQVARHSQMPQHLTHRLLLPGDEVKFVSIKCETDFDTSGSPLKSFGTIQDITDLSILSEELNYYIEKDLEKYSFQNILTKNIEMKKTLELAAIVSRSPHTTVALLGETGCGKGVIARAIHAADKNATGKYVAVNCAAIPGDLLESELFGHKCGAFTGAVSDRDGKFYAARRGTIFLDEIGDMPPQIQVKLLRVLEERTFEKVGSERTQNIECRIIVATNRNLSQMVLNGSFREDLFHRINVFPLHIPPLRERIEDVPTLCEYILQQLQQQFGRRISGITKEAIQLLQSYHWPGNIRELRNFLERAAILSNGSLIETRHFTITSEVKAPAPAATEGLLHYNLSLPTTDLSLDSLNAQILAITLERCGGNKTHAAKALKIGRSAYYGTK